MGGNRLAQKLQKPKSEQPIGESWEISGVDENISEVSNGVYKGVPLNKILEFYKGKFLGKENYKRFGNTFPLLIKFLDANTDLSIQVHPDDKMAKRMHRSYGKSEMWYIMDCDKDAKVVSGLHEDYQGNVSYTEVNHSNYSKVFRQEKVDKEDCFYIPAGRVHAIGAGMVVAEIQQTSDITYRVYDYDRYSVNGEKRELHLQLAEKATKRFEDPAKKDYDKQANGTVNMVDCEFFTTNSVSVKGITRKNYDALDSFVVLMCVSGVATMTTSQMTESIRTGETVLLPASCDYVELCSAGAKFLEIYIQPESSQNRMAS